MCPLVHTVCRPAVVWHGGVHVQSGQWDWRDLMECCTHRRSTLKPVHHFPSDSGAVHVPWSTFQAGCVWHHGNQCPPDVASQHQHWRVADPFLYRRVFQPWYRRGEHFVNFIDCWCEMVSATISHEKTSARHQWVLSLLCLPTRFGTCSLHTGDSWFAQTWDTRLHAAVTVAYK